MNKVRFMRIPMTVIHQVEAISENRSMNAAVEQSELSWMSVANGAAVNPRRVNAPMPTPYTANNAPTFLRQR